jgi:xanthine dehydrogenase YagS FAD-binding subunit
MKDSVETPMLLVDISRLPLQRIEPLPDGGLRLGALAKNAETANHPLVLRQYPMLAQAILSGASPQLRNRATNGGNLLQRTRCHYFMDVGFAECNKRSPGSGCGALVGVNRNHAILGASDACIATNPSDMCVALAALEARIRVEGPRGERVIPFEEFHRPPGNTPQLDTNLRSDELVLSIDLPPTRFSEHSYYLKVRDRASYEFALVSVAAALDMTGNTIRAARIALGGVAHKPWRSIEAEQELQGKAPSAAVFEQAAEKAIQGAKAYRENGFKVELARRSIVRALRAAGGTV